MSDAHAGYQAALEDAWFPDPPPNLTAAHHQALLRLARESIVAHLTGQELDTAPEVDAELLRPAGVFVTLRERPRRRGAGGEEPLPFDECPLRGCIGHVPADTPLAEAVGRVAVNAATLDPRFVPVRADEIDRLRIKVAVLSPLRLVRALEEVIVGLHGLLIIGQGRRGLLLPDVPERYGWSASEFLANLYHKAGLPRGSWPERAELYRFVTIVVGEEGP